MCVRLLFFEECHLKPAMQSSYVHCITLLKSMEVEIVEAVRLARGLTASDE